MFDVEFLADHNIYAEQHQWAERTLNGAQLLGTHWINRNAAGKALAILEFFKLTHTASGKFLFECPEHRRACVVFQTPGSAAWQIDEYDMAITTDFTGKLTGTSYVNCVPASNREYRQAVDWNASIPDKIKEEADLAQAQGRQPKAPPKPIDPEDTLSAWLIALHCTTDANLPGKGVVFHIKPTYEPRPGEAPYSPLQAFLTGVEAAYDKYVDWIQHTPK